MIIERALLERVTVQVQIDAYGAGSYGAGRFGDPYLDNIVPHLTSIRIRRGGTRDGLGAKTDVGLMTLALKNAHDPLVNGYLAPRQPVVAAVDGVTVFTGVIDSINAAYPLDKATGTYRAVTTVTVSDAVADHGKTPRYGVRTAEGYETFEDRIIRLADSARTPIEAPQRNAPRKVYAL